MQTSKGSAFPVPRARLRHRKSSDVMSSALMSRDGLDAVLINSPYRRGQMSSRDAIQPRQDVCEGSVVESAGTPCSPDGEALAACTATGDMPWQIVMILVAFAQRVGTTAEFPLALANVVSTKASGQIKLAAGAQSPLSRGNRFSRPHRCQSWRQR